MLLDRSAAVAMAAACIFLAFAVWGETRRLSRADGTESRRFKLGRSAVLLMISVAVCFASTWALQYLVWKGVQEKLEPGNLLEARVEGKPAADQSQIVEALRGMYQEHFRRSHHTKQIRVDIRSRAGNEALILARDSDVQTEYWVLVPRYWVTSTKAIGRVSLAGLHQVEALSSANAWQQ